MKIYNILLNKKSLKQNLFPLYKRNIKQCIKYINIKKNIKFFYT